MNKAVYQVVLIGLIIILFLTYLRQCNTINELNKAVQLRAKVDSLFNEQGKELEKVISEKGDIFNQVKALQLNKAQLELLVQDKDAKIKKLKPIALLQNAAKIKIDTSFIYLHDTLPCDPFDTTLATKNEFYSYTVNVTNKSHKLINLEIPLKQTITITEKNRFLKSPDITVQTKYDNPYLLLSQSSAAINKEHKGLRLANIGICLSIGLVSGIILSSFIN